MTNLLDNVSVVLETDEVVAVDKPAGLIVHADGRTSEPNLCDWILEHYPETKGVGEPIEMQDGSVIKRPGIVHRLDRETSGVLLVARTNKAHTHLKKQFKQRRVTKTYNAFVYGRIQEGEFTIDTPLGRSKGDFRKRAIEPYTRGETKSARTDFKLEKATDTASFVVAYPKTGRTHQIRVHLKSIHHPILCDSLYASGKECLFDLDRQALHARRIQFTLPNGSGVVAEAGLPEDLQKALKEMG